jgi:hypothetical protein
VKKDIPTPKRPRTPTRGRRRNLNGTFERFDGTVKTAHKVRALHKRRMKNKRARASRKVNR